MSASLTCAACGGNVPSAHFCAACGAGLDSPPAAVAAPTALAATVLVAASPPRRLQSRTIGILALATVVLAVGVWWGFGRVTEHVVSGDLSLTDSSSTSDLAAGDGCSGSGGYDDMTEGAQVVLEDGDGSTLATSSLSNGEYDGSACVFTFSLTGATKAKFYVVKVGSSRGDMRYSYAELAGQDWTVHLTLGE